MGRTVHLEGMKYQVKEMPRIYLTKRIDGRWRIENGGGKILMNGCRWIRRNERISPGTALNFPDRLAAREYLSVNFDRIKTRGKVR